LHADAAVNTMADASLRHPRVVTTGETPVTVAHYLSTTPEMDRRHCGRLLREVLGALGRD